MTEDDLRKLAELEALRKDTPVSLTALSIWQMGWEAGHKAGREKAPTYAENQQLRDRIEQLEKAAAVAPVAEWCGYEHGFQALVPLKQIPVGTRLYPGPPPPEFDPSSPESPDYRAGWNAALTAAIETIRAEIRQ